MKHLDSIRMGHLGAVGEASVAMSRVAPPTLTEPGGQGPLAAPGLCDVRCWRPQETEPPHW